MGTPVVVLYPRTSILQLTYAMYRTMDGGMDGRDVIERYGIYAGAEEGEEEEDHNDNDNDNNNRKKININDSNINVNNNINSHNRSNSSSSSFSLTEAFVASTVEEYIDIV